MNYSCNRCQDRTVVGGFMPAPCPECRAQPSDDPERLAAIILLWEQATADRERLTKELERLREIAEACHAGIDALWNAYHAGAWEMNHYDDDNDVPCPEDDTCECEGKEAARLLSKASGLLTSWKRIDALRSPQRQGDGA